MTLWEQIDRALEDGPGTAMDVALELGIDSRRAGVNLRAMWMAGKLAREIFHPSERGPSIRHSVWMYSKLD